MERITEIKKLKPGDKIWTIDTFSGRVDIIEFVCIHPHNAEYSIFLNSTYDGMPKFFNERLKDGNYELYDGSDECWLRIHKAEIDWHKKSIECIEARIKSGRKKP